MPSDSRGRPAIPRGNGAGVRDASRSEQPAPPSLRAWRTRRRVSQLELATRAGTTQRHVSFIESGRSVPGPGDDHPAGRVARGADPGAQRAAAGRRVRARVPGDALTTRSWRRCAPPSTGSCDGHLPYPAVVVDRHGDLVSANAGFDLLTRGVDPALLARRSASPGSCCTRTVSRRASSTSTSGPGTSSTGSGESLRNPNDRLARLAEELAGLRRAPRQLAAHLGFAVPLHLRIGDRDLRLITTLTHFGTATDVTVAELRLEAFLPADDATAELLGSLACRA